MTVLANLLLTVLAVTVPAGEALSLGRRAFVGTLGGVAGASSGLLPDALSAAAEEGFSTTPSGLQVKDLYQPDMGAASITNAFKDGDYIRVDYKGYLDGFGKTLIDDTAKTGPIEIQLGVGATQGSTGLQKSALKVSLLKGLEEACQGQTVGSKRQIIIPAELAYGKGGKSGIGYDVPAGQTVYMEFRVRGRVFAGQLKRPQENFRENDQVEKINAVLGIGA